MKIMVFDPGDSTGWVMSNTDKFTLSGGTLYKDMAFLYTMITIEKPDIIVFETFHLYPGAAKHLIYNDFYPCQVIGVIKLAALNYGVQYLVEQAPSIKKYSGGIDNRFKDMMRRIKVSNGEDLTEHIKDAYLHLKYFELNTLQNKKKLEKWFLPEFL